MVNDLRVPLSAAQLQHLSQVISELERHTDGEIRLMIVKSSSAQGHLRYLLWFLFSTLALFGLWVERHLLIWTADWWLVPALFVLTYLLATIAARFGGVARAFATDDDLERQAFLRAEVEFHREGMGQTTQKTGILLFISMLEHRAVVLADQGIHQKLNESVWKDVVATLLEGPRSGAWAVALEKALRQCGALLAEHFPNRAGDKNELPNHVIVKD